MGSHEAAEQGVEADEDAPEAYGAGIYDHIGLVIPSSAFAPAGWDFVQEVDAALAAEGMPEPLRAKALIARGFPLWELAAPEPFPLFGGSSIRMVDAAHHAAHP